MLPLTVVAEPVVESAGRVRLVGADVTVRLDLEGAADVAVEVKELDDPNLRALWGERLWRVLVTPSGPLDRGALTCTFSRAD